MEAAVRWSPHAHSDDANFILLDIVDSSLTLNQVDVLTRKEFKYHTLSTYGKLPNFAAFDWSKTSNHVISFGLVSGNASLVKLNPGHQTSQVIATYRVKQQRRCNSIALSKGDWLAVALDKTRSDVCLNIYDAASSVHDPIRRLCPAELVSSVRFFSQQPQELLAGAQRAFIRLYDLRDGFAGTGNLQVTTRNVNNIAVDPLDENYFASGGSTDDPSVTVWDRRWISQSTGSATSAAVFDFKPILNNSSRASVWSLRYSGKQRGRLAVCSSVGELKIIDMVNGSTLSTHAAHYTPPNPLGGQAWTNNHYVSETQTLEPPFHDTHRGRPSDERVIAFDWIRPSAGDHEQSLVVLRADRSTEILHVSAKSHAGINARSAFSLASQDLFNVEPASLAPALLSQPRTLVQSHAHSHEEDVNASQTLDEPDEASLTVKSIRDPLLSQILQPATIPQRRCKDGYLFNCSKNVSIVAGNWKLERLWETIGRLQYVASDDGMTFESLDLSYVGIKGLWDEDSGSSVRRRLSPSPTKPSDAVIGLNEKRDIPPFEGERTEYPEHRQICLALCGWKFTTEVLEEECQQLVDRGLHYQAIVQAVLHGAKHLALNLLRTLIRGKTIPNIGLGALLAADELNDEQREMTLWMAADTKDTALKALLAFLNTGSWVDVMNSDYLDFGYRMALALKYLNDTELDGFIHAETERVIKEGDLEGVLLTGLTEQSMDLFQAYITRTNDLQTAVLATAFTNPLYVDDARWQMWKETLFMQMQSWRAFAERSRFTVEHNRLAKTREGRCLVEPPVPQVKINCVHCQKEVGRSLRPDERSKIIGPAANAGTVCLRCGRHMPRCSICTLWLGTSDPRRAKSAQKADKNAPADKLMERMLVFCTRCEHGFHAHHAREWFSKNGVCPSPGCDCGCNGGQLGGDPSLANLLNWL